MSDHDDDHAMFERLTDNLSSADRRQLAQFVGGIGAVAHADVTVPPSLRSWWGALLRLLIVAEEGELDVLAALDPDTR